MRARVGAAVLLALLPVPGLFGMRSSLRTAGADPSFYLGLVTDYEAIVARFGQTYHGNRISYILVDRFFFDALGPTAGFFTARYLVLLAGLLAAFLIGARLGGPATGALIAGLVAFTPWLPRQLLWTHYDGFATVYLLAATALLVVPMRPRTRAVAEVLAGLFFALAVNANLVLIAVVGITGLGWWALRWRRGHPSSVLIPTIRLVGGFVGGSLAIALALRSMFPDGEAFPELVALRVGLSVLGADTWFAPLGGMGRSLLVLLPIPIIAALLILGLVREHRSASRWLGQARMAVVTLLGVLALASVLHFVFLSTWFSASYYTIYHLPGVVHGLAVAIAPLLNDMRSRTRGTTVAVALSGALAALLTAPAPGPVVTGLVVSIALGAIAVLVMAVRGNPNRVAFVLTVSIVLMGTVVSPWAVGPIASSEEIARTDAIEWDVFAHSVALVEFIERVAAPDERLKFWHTLEGSEGDLLTRLNMVYYGTGEGRLHVKGSPGMPVLGDGELTAVRDEAPFLLVLMATDRRSVTDAMVSLRLSSDAVLRERASTTFAGAVLDVELLVLEVGGPTSGTLRSLAAPEDRA